MFFDIEVKFMNFKCKPKTFFLIKMFLHITIYFILLLFISSNIYIFVQEILFEIILSKKTFFKGEF